jgi:isopentenyl-diphosphate delta-isomerase
MPDRKKDHIDLALTTQTTISEKDNRFIYEPVLSAHPGDLGPVDFLQKTFKTPIWVSSMTGGTRLAKKINENIARVCNDFGMGMGLGSCRRLLDDDTYFEDFNVRKFIGDMPLYANLGVAQIEEMLTNKQTDKIRILIDKLQADGLVVHINPLQEYFQPEGNRINRLPIETIEELLLLIEFPVIVKEVGQGMGKKSIKRLLQLPIEALEFGAYGGTNFSLVEMKRNQDLSDVLNPFAYVGQTANQMVESINEIVLTSEIKCRQVIISGGINNFLDGYYLMQKCSIPSIYGQASSVLKHAKESYEQLYQYIEAQAKGLALAYSYLRLNPEIL